MATTPARITVRREGSILIVGFVDRNILDETNIQQIGMEISRLLDAEGRPRLIIDFANVNHMSSAALGELIKINNKVRNLDGQLRLVNIASPIYDVFTITKLDRLFQICKTVKDAMQQMG